MAMTVRMDAISLGAAQRVLDAAIARAGELGEGFRVCVADPAGEPVLASPRIFAVRG